MFDLVRKTPMPEYNGDALFYVHRETGMEVFHIKNSDAEMTCNFMFSTPSQDSKGVAHIIEHTVLCGSKRFPVKDPFSQVLLSSPNTFLNAITFCDKTMYPFSSPLKKDFDILFDIYADAVFAPLLRKQSFYQEGIRSFEGKFDGVVFNEMCGARSTEDSVVQTNSTKDLFRGTPYEYDSGGDPYYIADLTYEEYVARYRKWYSPTNCRLFLFGDLDTQKYLDKLEDLYLKDCPRGEKIIPKSEYYLQNNIKPMRSRATCPAGDASSIVMTWLTTPSDDPLEILTVSILVDILLGNPGAPLYKAIIESGLGEDLNSQCGTDVDTPVLTFTAGFSHAKSGAEDEIETFLLDQFRTFVRDGLPQDLVQAAIKRQEFRIQEIPGDGLPFGIATCLKASRSWMRGRDPEEGVANIARLERLKARVAEGRYFEDWMQRNILENERRCLLTVVSDPDYDDKFQTMLQQKLEAHIKDGLVGSEEDRQDYEQFVASQDSPEALATIPRITVKDLPRAIPRYDQKLIRLANGAKLYDFRLFTRGIVYISALFDTRNLNFEEKRLLPLMVRTVQMCGTSKHDYSQIGTLVKTYTGSFFVYPNAGSDVHHKPVSCVVMKTKMLAEDTSTALDLIAEILLDADMTDRLRLKAALTDMITEFETGYTYSGNAYASMNAASVFSATALESELDMGTELWFYLSGLKKDLESGKTSYEALSASLTKLRDKVFTQRSMKIQIGSDCKDDSLVQVVSSFVDKFPIGKFVRTSDFYRDFRVKQQFGTPDKPTAFTVSSGPAFNALAMKFDRVNDRNYVALTLLSSILTSGYLWNVVRGCNGAYGVECHVDGMEDLMVFSSYRDPNIEQTYKVYLQSLSQGVSESDIEYAIVTIIGKEIRPLSPQSRCAEALKRVVYGRSTARYLKSRKYLLEMTPEDLSAAAKGVLSDLEGRCSATVVCSKDMVRNIECLKTIVLPI